MSWFDENDDARPTRARPQPVASAPGPAGGGAPGDLPPGATLQPDGSIRMPDGTILPLPAGMERDPQHPGILRPIAGTTPPVVGSPGSLPGSVPGGDFHALFDRLFPGETLTPQMLAEKEAELGRYGIRLNRNAAGLATDFTLPDGTIIDPIQGAGSGLNRKQWLVQSGPGGATLARGGTSAMPDLPRWTETFNYEDFKPPTAANDQNDPGYSARLAEGQQALERSAAARGTLLGGGTLKDLASFSQDYAANEYGNVFNRALTTYGQNYGKALTAYQGRYNEYLNKYGQALGENELAYGRGQSEIDRAWQRLYGLAGLGLQGAAGASGAGMNYANQAGGYYTGQGNAAAAGQIGGANAWQNAFNYGANAAAQYPWIRGIYGNGYGRMPFARGGADWGGYYG